MATYTFYATANSGTGSSWNTGANYAYARQGNTANKGCVASTGSLTIGQLRANTYLYQCMETFIEFDTSSLAGKSISSVQLQLYPTALQNGAAFTAEARLNDYGTTIEAADWVAGSDLASKTLLATLASSAAGINAYRTFTDVAFVANINKTGKTRIVLASSEQRLNSAPANNVNEYVTIDGGDSGNPPKLIVVTNETTGQLTATLADATLSATAELAIAANFTATLADAILTAAGALSSTGAGSAVIQLADDTMSIVLATETHGYLDITLEDATLTTVALVELTANLSVTLADATLDAQGNRPITGDLTVTLADATIVSSTLNGITGSFTTTLRDAVISAAETTPMWPTVYDFPQSPLDGTWTPTLGDDTVRSDREVGARQARSRNGGNYSEVSFSIMLVSRVQRVELDRFFESDCQHGTRAFIFEDPETGSLVKWTWAQPPLFEDAGNDNFVVQCVLRKEAA